MHADKIMSQNSLTLPSVADMVSLKAALYSPHHGFPVLNTAGNLVGLISKSFLIPLIKKKAFYDKNKIGRAAADTSASEQAAVNLNDSMDPEAIGESMNQEANEIKKRYEMAHDAENGGFPAIEPE